MNLPDVTPLPGVALVTHRTPPALLEAARDYAQAGICAATRRAYGETWQRWMEWAGALDLAGERIDGPAVALWLADLARSGAAASTVARHLAGLGTLARIRGLAAPSDHPEVKAIMRGIRRRSDPSRGAAPLLLADLLAGLPRGPAPRQVRDRALLLVGWAGALRRSEISAMTWPDLIRCPEGVIVRIPRSKTDPEGHGAAIGIPIGQLEARSPVVALEAWRDLLASRGLDLAGPVFRPISRHCAIGPGPIGPEVAAVAVREAAIRAGLDPSRYTGHSLRAGFVTEAARAGIPEWRIIRQTRHRNTVTLRGYIREGGIWRDNAASALL